MPPRPKTIEDIDTPAVLIDVDRASANIARAQQYADRHGLKLRHQNAQAALLGQKQVEAGAVGITCQKIGEAEVMADAGLADIFLPYNILRRAKLQRLHALHGRVALAVTADTSETISGHAATFSDPARPLKVLAECDTGMGRCGVQTPDEALSLARQIARHPAFAFGGLMTYPAAGKQREAEQWLHAARELIVSSGLSCDVVTSGGTPDMWGAGETRIVTEYRPGTYIYLDRYQVAKGAGSIDDCALTVLSTVVSRPTATRAVVDAGSKALSSDTLGLSDLGELIGHPEAVVTGLSEEHGTVSLKDGAPLAIRDRVRILPNHACVVSNLFDEVYLISGEGVVDILPVAARGCVGSSNEWRK
jgi:D-serine deaminase-like pyridoxal phosphate-dependent protein